MSGKGMLASQSLADLGVMSWCWPAPWTVVAICKPASWLASWLVAASCAELLDIVVVDFLLKDMEKFVNGKGSL